MKSIRVKEKTIYNFANFLSISRIFAAIFLIICNIFKKGSKIHAHASVKNPRKNSRDIVFRINEFDIPVSATDENTQGV